MAGISDLFATLFGNTTTKDDRAAKDSMKAALAAYQGIDTPDLQQISPEEYKWLGDYKPVGQVSAPSIQAGQDTQYNEVDPRLAALSQLDGTAYNDINVDPRFKNDQVSALDALSEISQGGLTAADKAALNQVQNEAAQADRGRREAILQNAQARGMGGGGQALLAQLQSSQAATDRANQSGLDIAGMAQQRALDAIMQRGNLAGQMGQQEFGQQADIAGAKDAIARFNAQNSNQMSINNAEMQNQAAMQNAQNQLANAQYNRNTGIDVQRANVANKMGAQQFNAQAGNQAAMLNQQGRQSLAQAGVDNRNDAQRYNANLPQQQFSNALAKAGGVAGSQQAASGFYSDESKRKAAKNAQDADALIKAGSWAAGKI
jgi:hypothetical protein